MPIKTQVMAYTATYATADVSAVIIDMIGTIFATLVDYAPIILIVAIAGSILGAVYAFMRMR